MCGGLELPQLRKHKAAFYVRPAFSGHFERTPAVADQTIVAPNANVMSCRLKIPLLLPNMVGSGKGLRMPATAATHKEFIDEFIEAVEEQDAVAQAALAPVVLWQPTTAQMASVKHLNMNCVQQTAAARNVASQRQMATLRQSQDAVRFYYGRGVVVEQMWNA